MPTTTDSKTAQDKRQDDMTIRVYSTLSRSKEPLQPVQPGRIGIYLCGPTVYKPSHIGHMVGPVVFDVIKRYLVYNGFDVTWVVNITDVDDKLIAEAERRGMAMSQVAEEMTADYFNNLRALNVTGVDHFPKATENIDEIIALIESLIERGFAYVADGDVYFDVSKHPEYGKLSGRNLESLQGEGGEAAERKRHVADFALWKSAKPGEPSWKGPWSPGRPGWHIECSAMARALLGETFDFHGGGLDLVFPHHENEIAQSECCHGRPMARYWMHNGLMRASRDAGKVGGRAERDAPAIGSPPEDAASEGEAKISKSTGAQPFRELLTRHAPETIRFFLLRTHYRRPIDFGEPRIEEARTALDAFYRFFKRYERITGNPFYELAAAKSRSNSPGELESDPLSQQVARHRDTFLAAMDDDFNTGAAVGELFELVHALNKFCEDENLEAAGQPGSAPLVALRSGATVLREMSQILGLFLNPPASTPAASDGLVDQLMELLIELRAMARKKKDFQTADQIRDSLSQMGIQLEDRPNGTEWSKKGSLPI